MAYTIIGQNNSVTTIDDGNGHTLHVPSRVSLAIGTTFTIVEVNNNMATLEDSNGKVYRDIPCVVDLVGSGGGGGSSYTAGTGIDITSGVISVTTPTLQNTATGTNGITVLGTATASINAINIGVNSVANANNAIAYGREAEASGVYSVALGTGAKVYSGNNQAIQIGEGTNYTSGSFQVKSYTMMNSDGTIPTARLTKVNTTVTIAVADWNGGTTVTKTVAGITATGVVFVSPDPTDQSAYTSAGILCTAQGTNSLTFTATTTPTADIDVNVVML